MYVHQELVPDNDSFSGVGWRTVPLYVCVSGEGEGRGGGRGSTLTRVSFLTFLSEMGILLTWNCPECTAVTVRYEEGENTDSLFC